MKTYPKSTIHCTKCDSQNLRLTNAVHKWNIETQEWEFSDSPEGYMYFCLTCYTDDSDCVEKEIRDSMLVQ